MFNLVCGVTDARLMIDLTAFAVAVAVIEAPLVVFLQSQYYTFELVQPRY